MSKLRRSLCLVLALVMGVAMVFAGCGQTTAPATTAGETTSATTAPTATTTPTATAAAAPVELKWILIGNQQEPDTDKICEAANAYLKDKINATIKLNTFTWGDDYKTKVQTMLATGEEFDIAFTASWAMDYYTYAANGALLPLNDLLAKHPKIEELLGKDFMNGSAINGVRYAVPTNKEKAHNWGFLLKKDLVDKYKVDVASIKSMADLEPYFEQIKKGEPGVYPLLTVNQEGPVKFLDWDKIAGDGVPGAFPPDGKSTTVINEWAAPETLAMFSQLHDYYKKGYIHPDAAVQDNFNAEMATGKYFAVVQSMKPGKGVEMSNSTGIEWVQVDITRPVISNRETTGALLSIPSASKNPETAMAFIELLYTDKYIKNLFDFGIEGTHYVKVSNEVIDYAPGTDGGKTSGYNPGNGWKYGDQFKNFLMPNEDPQKWQQFIDYNASALPLSNSLGFAFNSEAVSNEIAACSNVETQYYKQFYTGSVDPAVELPKFLEAQKAAGVDKIIAEMQKQYDAWRAATGK